MMASGPLEPGGMPGVLDPPVACRQEKAADQRRAVLAGERLAILGHDAEAENPVGMLAAARERPASVHAPSAIRRLGRPRRLGGASDDHVRAFAVDLLVALRRQQ